MPFSRDAWDEHSLNFSDRVQTCLSAIQPQILNLQLCNRFGFGTTNLLSNFTTVALWQFRYLAINNIPEALKPFELQVDCKGF
jgi:hypothetical protein